MSTRRSKAQYDRITNGCVCIDNPVKRCPNRRTEYIGSADEYGDWQYQGDNRDRLVASLLPFGIRMTDVFATRWSSDATQPFPDRYCFVVRFSHPSILWQKTEGMSAGSGQNWLFFGPQRIHLTSWLYTATDEDRRDMIDGLDY